MVAKIPGAGIGEDANATSLTLKNLATADNSTFTLNLQTAEADIAQDDVLGKINFQAPAEGTGTDAILVAAAIQAVSEGDFSSSSNATKLDFMTGASEAAATKMSLGSSGLLTVNHGITYASADITAAASTIYHDSSNRLRMVMGTAGLLVVEDGNSTAHMKIDADGHVTMPLQPYFRHVPASGQNDLAINQWNDIAFATEREDRNGDFATATFTAPVTGVYMFTTSLYMQSIDTDFASVEAAFHTSNDIYQVFILEPGKTFSSDSSYYSATGAVICDMDASDTCILKVYPAGGAAQMDINVSSTFTGGLLY